MNKAQEAHMKKVALDFTEPMMAKYRRGQKEHGGNLWEKATLGMMTEEAIDFWVYLHVHLQHIALIKQKLSEAIRTNPGVNKDSDIQAARALDTIKEVYNILEFGNEHGKRFSD